MPSINGIPIKIFKVADSAEKHEFRERYLEKDKSYGLLKVTLAQPVFFSAEEIRYKEELLKFYSLGYFIFKSSTLSALGISPAPDGSSWIDYRLFPKINGSYSERALNIVEVREKSPWKGSFTLWYVYFNEVKNQPVNSGVVKPIEERQTGDITKVVQVVREY